MSGKISSSFAVLNSCDLDFGLWSSSCCDNRGRCLLSEREWSSSRSAVVNSFYCLSCCFAVSRLFVFLFDSSAHVVPATGRSRLRDRVSDRRWRIKHAPEDWHRGFIGGDSDVRADRAIEGVFLCSTSKHAAHSWEVTFSLSCLFVSFSAAWKSGPLVYNCVRFH